MDFNNIEQRISRLYISINAHFDSFKQTEVIQEEKIENGEKIIIVTIGASPINQNQQFDAFNKLISVIHNIFNLKDHLKNYFSDNNLNKKLVEEEVDNSLHLKLIADLSNQEKHGYPLNNRRSKLDPRIENIQNSNIIKMPVTKLLYNPMQGRVILTANITDLNHNFIISFDELIDKSLEKWEDFLLKNIPEIAEEILKTRELKKEKELIINKIQQFVDEVYLILDNCEWTDIKKEELVRGMIVRNTTNGDIYNRNGMIIDFEIDKNSNTIVKVINDLPFPFCNYDIGKYNWQMIDYLKLKPNDLIVLVLFFKSYPSIIQKINSLI